MAMDLEKSLAHTAAAGLLAGLAACAGGQEAAKDPSAEPLSPGDGEPAASAEAEQDAPADCCKGKNECKGKGNCKVEGSHDCAGQNECKAQGGCKTPDCP